MMRFMSFSAAVLLSMLTSPAFAGEYGDHCTTGLSSGQMIKTNCSINAVFEGKTYCFSSDESRSGFLMHPAETIAKAAVFYDKNAEPEREKISQADAVRQIQSKGCDLSNKDAGYLELDGMDLRHCKMVNTSFFGAYLRGANLSGANMQRAYLNLARLEKADLSGADLTDAIIFQAIFDKTSFKGANLTHARVIGTLGNVDMSGANISNGRFGLDVGNQPMGQMKFDSVGGNFANANFEGADLNIASFRFGNLTGANLRNTNLYRADLAQADLTGADLTGANLESADVDGAIFKDVKGLATVKGFAQVKGKCLDCNVAAQQP
ncbi:secreted effector protein pipB2 [mine drainage metagenome]|uniref:Secreted effector protein pipB2 n=1 Tax=mine drainage metagenome TaxID=410659 RepID=A0A1J5R9B4_9ZZZZ